MMQPPMNREGAHPARDGKLIRREDARGWLAGAQCLAHARDDAQAILERAQVRAVEEEARGYAAGVARAEAERQHLILDTILQRDAWLAAAEPELVGVVLNAVRKIFAEFDDMACLRIAVSRALKTLRDQPQATVRVHPSQYDALRASVDALSGSCPNPCILTVESDARLKPGTCVLSSEMGIVETDLESQIREIEYVMTRRVSPALSGRVPAEHTPRQE